MAKKSKGKIINFVFLGLVLVALVLVIVGMFVGQVTHSYMKGTEEVTESIPLFSDDWNYEKDFILYKVTTPSNGLGITAFILALVGLVVLIATGIMQTVLKKSGLMITVLRIAGVLLTVVGAILILVSGLTMASGCYGKYQEEMEKAKIFFSAGTGVWLGFVGGLVGGICGALPLLKPFK